MTLDFEMEACPYRMQSHTYLLYQHSLIEDILLCESESGEAPVFRVDSKTAVLLPHKMFKLPLMTPREYWPLIGQYRSCDQNTGL